ncbi:MAG TPA: hypothetical protein ENJ09_14400 [Planctomycetes bacterium]|nr:hypothetical protein [Planctomycetota bacterium]
MRGAAEEDAPRLSPPTLVVHRSSPEVAEEFAARLREEGIAAEALDRPGLLVLLATFGSYRVRIGVPPEQEEEARAAMAAWDREAAPRMEELASGLRRQVKLAAIPFVLVALAGVLLTDGWDFVPWLACAAPAAALITFLALALVERGRNS